MNFSTFWIKFVSFSKVFQEPFFSFCDLPLERNLEAHKTLSNIYSLIFICFDCDANLASHSHSLPNPLDIMKECDIMKWELFYRPFLVLSGKQFSIFRIVVITRFSIQPFPSSSSTLSRLLWKQTKRYAKNGLEEISVSMKKKSAEWKNISYIIWFLFPPPPPSFERQRSWVTMAIWQWQGEKEISFEWYTTNVHQLCRAQREILSEKSKQKNEEELRVIWYRYW